MAYILFLKVMLSSSFYAIIVYKMCVQRKQFSSKIKIFVVSQYLKLMKTYHSFSQCNSFTMLYAPGVVTLVT